MVAERLPIVIIVVGISILAGVSDSQGFVHAARIWQGGKVVLHELGKSALGFGVGMGGYWLSLKYLQVLGVLAPETQTLIGFGVTMLGVALASGRCLRWQPLDQVVGVVVLLGLIWLLCRTSE